MKDNCRKKIIRSYYSARAVDYDRQKSRTWKSEEGFRADVFDEILAAFTGFRNKTILEVGVGSGRMAKPLVETVNSHLVGLDLSRPMLRRTGKKTTKHRQHLDLVLGDAERPPFKAETFDALLCISTMHYFTDQEKAIDAFAGLLKKGGIFIFGDLSIHELDTRFFEELERAVSKAHSKYYKASEMKEMLETHALTVTKLKTIAYRKAYTSIVEDKGKYFDVELDTLQRYLETASQQERRQYNLTETELTQYYTVAIATKKPELSG